MAEAGLVKAIMNVFGCLNFMKEGAHRCINSGKFCFSDAMGRHTEEGQQHVVDPVCSLSWVYNHLSKKLFTWLLKDIVDLVLY